MIKKKQAIEMPTQKALLLNGGFILIVAASLFAALRISFSDEVVEPCTHRYMTALQMGLERNGQTLRITELQGQLGNTDWNLLDHARIVQLTGGSVPQAFSIDAGMPATAANPDAEPDDPKPRQGVGFLWSPAGMPRASAACLAYTIRVPHELEFGGGGQLPGIFGAKGKPAGFVREPDFSIRPVWNPQGTIGVIANVLDTEQGKPVAADARPEAKLNPPTLENDRSSTLQLVRGDWMSVEQEVVMNDPQQANGIVRLWVNGQLAFERTNVALRADDETLMAGVYAEVVAKRVDQTPRPPQQVLVTPFEVRW